jgi:hypothetical protein
VENTKRGNWPTFFFFSFFASSIIKKKIYKFNFFSFFYLVIVGLFFLIFPVVVIHQKVSSTCCGLLASKFKFLTINLRALKYSPLLLSSGSNIYIYFFGWDEVKSVSWSLLLLLL